MTYFTQNSIDFLYFNHKYNSKSWYQEHKDDYKKYLLSPFQDLVVALTPTMLSIDEQFVTTPKVNATISRLYKDLRFAKDKTTLYRDCMWLTFIRDKKCNHGLPGFFFELSPYKFRYGCGYYEADTASMQSARNLILNNSPYFQRAKECFDNQTLFTFYGESVKRTKYPDQPQDIRLWLDKKYFGFLTESQDIDLLLSPNLADTLAQQFLMIKPIYDFMAKAEELAIRN